MALLLVALVVVVVVVIESECMNFFRSNDEVVVSGLNG